jgi:hypothetical protein
MRGTVAGSSMDCRWIADEDKRADNNSKRYHQIIESFMQLTSVSFRIAFHK